MLDKLVKDESEEMKWTCLLLNFYPILEIFLPCWPPLFLRAFMFSVLMAGMWGTNSKVVIEGKKISTKTDSRNRFYCQYHLVSLFYFTINK